MTVPRFLVGLLLLAVALGPLAAGAWALRARMLGWVGVPARVAEIVMVLATVVVVSEALGVVSLYLTVPMVIALAAAGGLEYWIGQRRGHASHPGTARGQQGEDDLDVGDYGPGEAVPTRPMGRWGVALTVIALSVLLADWAPHVVDAYHHGMSTIDTVWYHLPMAARWVQTGSLAHVQYFDNDAITAFYPGNSELFHGLGMLMLGGDLLSPLVDLLWLGLALVSAWSIGRRYRVAPLTVTGAALVFATPGMVGTQPGGAYSDVVTLALLLATFAILIEAHRHETPRLAAYGIAGLAAGLALGTKFTMLIPVAALTVAVVVLAPKGQRLRRSESWFVGLTATGLFWYFRNIIAVGTPLPSIGLHLGPLNLPNLSNENGSVSSVAHYFLDGHIWRDFFLPGLAISLGWIWWLVLLLVATGVVVGLVVGPTKAHRLMALTAGATVVGYVFTQQILGPPGHPTYFGVNLRYMAGGVVLGLVALPSAALRWPRLRNPIFGFYLAVLALLQVDPLLWPKHLKAISSPNIHGVDTTVGIGLAAIVAVVGVVVVLSGRPGRQAWARHRWAIVGSAGVLGIVALAVLLPFYQRNRYAETGFFNWGNGLHHQRVGIYGPYAFLQYPDTGRDQSNHIQYLGVEHPDGSFSPITDCPTWRRIINAGHYDQVFVSGAILSDEPQFPWTGKGTPTSMSPINGTGLAGALYVIKGTLDPATCPKTGS